MNRENPLYGWEVIESYDYPDYTLTILNLTSQEWMDGNLSLYDPNLNWELLSELESFRPRLRPS